MKYFLYVFLIYSSLAFGQNIFEKDVQDIVKKYDKLWDPSKETIVFTGSSSVRLWNSLETEFPKHQIVNTGFGGSQAYDLSLYVDELILRYNPKKVFIYEGDNDIFSKKKRKEIIAIMQAIVKKIKKKDPTTKIVLIAVKPSISRWRLRRKYRRLNKDFLAWSQTDPLIDFANVWDIMLKGRKVRKDIFVSDGLHMNAKGYALWHTIIKEYMTL